MQTFKLISCLFALCIFSLIVFFSIWDGPSLFLKKKRSEAISSHIEKHPEVKPENRVDYHVPSLERTIQTLKSSREDPHPELKKKNRTLLSHLYLKLDGVVPTSDEENEGRPDFTNSQDELPKFDAEGALGYRINEREEVFTATPMIGYTINFHIFKQTVKTVADAILNTQGLRQWNGPYVGLDTAFKFSRFSIDTGYFFHFVNFRQITLEMAGLEWDWLQQNLTMREDLKNGIGHTGALGITYRLGENWIATVRCKFKHFRTVNEKFNLPIEAQPVNSLQSFQAAGEIAYRF